MALVFVTLYLWAAFASPPHRNWAVPGTHLGFIDLGSVTDSYSFSVRRVGMRSKQARLDTLGNVVIYPVVRPPHGKIVYLGFERHYPPHSIGRRWLFWDFPSEFRAPDAHATTERNANFGDHLVDTIMMATADPRKLLPSGIYQVKWIVNNLLIDNGDSFRYAFHATEKERRPYPQ